MKTPRLMEFKRTLHEFLVQDNISTETDIVNHLIFKMIGIELSEERDYGFSFSNYRYGREKTSIQFRLPELSMGQLRNLLQFFQIPEDQYITNKALVLNDDYVFEQLIPTFKSYYQSLPATELLPYRIKSKAILESSAISTLKEYTEKVISTLCKGSKIESSEIIDPMIQLIGKVERLRSQPIFYKSIIETAHKIRDFMELSEVRANTQLAKELRLVSEGITLFARYHRNESVIALNDFREEVEKFLNTQGITASQCNVVEDTLLRLAKAQCGLKADSQYHPGSDNSRLVFKFIDMDKTNAMKVVNFLQSMGDETATEGYGHRQYGSSIPESMNESMMKTQAQSSRQNYFEPEEVLETHFIEVDGKFLYEKLFPALKTEIGLMHFSAPEILESYKTASKSWFDKKAMSENPTVSDKRDGLFHPTPMLVDLDDYGVALNFD